MAKETLKTRQKLVNRDFIKIYEDDVILHNKQEAKRIVVEHCGGVNIVAVNHNKKLLLVKQYRYPIGRFTFETPAGKLDKGKNLIDTALDELEEETGYTTDKLEKIGNFYVTPGYCTEVIHNFFTDKLKKVENPKQGDFDEFIDLYEVTLEEAKQMIVEEKIVDFKTIYGVQMYEKYLLNKLK